MATEACDSSGDPEQEEISTLTMEVRKLKEALAGLRHAVRHRQAEDHVVGMSAHECLGEVLRILRSILQKYSALRSPDVIGAAGSLIRIMKELDFEDGSADFSQLLETIDHLAMTFSSRVSEYLMGDLESSVFLAGKTKSCDNLTTEASCGPEDKKAEDLLSPKQIEAMLLQTEQSVELVLHRAKACAKYIKDITMYVEKKTHLDMEYAKSINKLSQTAKLLIKDDTSLALQGAYSAALEQDAERAGQWLVFAGGAVASRFLEPLSARRADHEKARKHAKDAWHRALAHTHDVASCVRKAHALLRQRRTDVERLPAEAHEDAMHKLLDAEAAYRASVVEANETHHQLEALKVNILKQMKDLNVETDNVLKTATVAYFHLQHSISLPTPAQIHELCDSTEAFDPEAHYDEFMKKQSTPADVLKDLSFDFETPTTSLEERKSTDSIESAEMFQEPSLVPFSSRHSVSKAALTHNFRLLKTPSRCRECDSYVYFMGADCTECGLVSHRKCLDSLSIRCGRKRLPRKLPIFGVELGQHLSETYAMVPFIIWKCVDEIDLRGRHVKGIYRVSGVKSKVDRLALAFENGFDLVDLSEVHPNVIANVLKVYLRTLPEPLLTFRLYPDFLELARDTSSDQKQVVGQLKELVQLLPQQNYIALAVLMLHLKRVADLSDLNTMPASNLGIVFGPTLLRPPEGLASLKSLADTVLHSRVVELMILHATEVFNQQEVNAAREYVAKKKTTPSRTFSFRDKGKKGKDEPGTSRDLVDEVGLLAEPEVLQLEVGDFTPKIFKGSLKDYQGLEGVSAMGKPPSEEVSDKVIALSRKTTSTSSSSSTSETAATLAHFLDDEPDVDTRSIFRSRKTQVTVEKRDTSSYIPVMGRTMTISRQVIVNMSDSEMQSAEDKH